MINLVRNVNNLLNGTSKYKSLYAIDRLNPFNFIPMRLLAWIVILNKNNISLEYQINFGTK